MLRLGPHHPPSLHTLNHPRRRRSSQRRCSFSAIWNCLAALAWLATCFGVIFTAPLVVLLIFEFMLYADVNNRSKVAPPSKVKTIAICEIVAGLVSLAPLVCGIIILTNLSRVDINTGKAPAR